jgi:S1-C subfamily serine protease
LLKRLRRAVVAAFLLLQLLPATAFGANGFATLADFPVPGGHFYTQASGQGLDAGFSVVDDGAGLLFTEFQRLGSVDKLGYPSSQRFVLSGFLTQATQKELLQWRPDSGHVTFVNIFDLLSDRGLDPTLAKTRLIPATADNSADAKISWPQIVSRHLAMLDQAPQIRARFFADANPVEDYGLPQGIADYGAVQVVRCERAAFQFWRVTTTFAKPGDVTLVNAGDLAKELGLVPANASLPTMDTTQIVAPPGKLLPIDPLTQAAALQVARNAQRSLVRLEVSFDGGTGIASGIVLDRSGNILTNQHVVDGAQSIKVTYVDGSSVAARVVGTDASNDLAVIQVPSGGTGASAQPATLSGGGQLAVGQYVVALGYSPFFPTSPAVRIGIYQATLNGSIAVIRTDSFMLPGDSGGMLLDLGGNVVGVNDEIRITRDLAQPIIAFSIDAAQALGDAQHLISTLGP